MYREDSHLEKESQPPVSKFFKLKNPKTGEELRREVKFDGEGNPTEIFDRNRDGVLIEYKNVAELGEIAREEFELLLLKESGKPNNEKKGKETGL